MKVSFGRQLPESQTDFNTLFAEGRVRYTQCVRCLDYFSDDNTHSKAGWAETQISGMCEDCFDNLFEE